ncbi:MAG TPA: response regulator [Oligoflexus sp.]|uniref:response regulator n=1 Tax=Oligoflexus sp. TaxID=1971216 RepID=UPI002D761415|nr:response regulator [Oligoflexus sp.]HYX39272.1 response regulator [Oligoflexus sp.]
MDIFFRDRVVKVLVVDPSGASRTLLSEVIRSLGFTDVNGVPNLKDALSFMEVEKVRWLITPVFSDQHENLLQVLNLYNSVPDLQQLRVSALVEETEMDVLPACFERGLLSYHKKPFTKDSLIHELKDFLQRYEKSNWQSSAMAGSYLRQNLTNLGLFEELLAFERQLLKLSPGDLGQYLNLAVPMIKTGKIDEAKAIISQVKKIDSSLEGAIKQICATHLPGEDMTQVTGTGMNMLGLKTAIILDSDTSIRTEIQSALTEMGVENIHSFEDGISAHEHIKQHNNPDLILQEWRVPKLTGPLFLQRAQEEGAKATPVIMVSSLIQKEDIPFVREMGVAHTLQKPFQRKELVQSIIWTIQQDRQPTEQGSMERKMRQLLSERQFDEAAKIKERYIADTTINIGSKELIEAEFAYASGDNEKARDFGIEAIKHAGESIFILNLLGKALINLREFETALKCFQKAQTLAPLNLERLCQIAEIHSELGDTSKANEILEEAKDIDPDSQRVMEAEAKAAINNGETSVAKKIMAQLKAMENVVAYMNNRSVALARCGMIQEGIEGYKKTLEAIPDERPDIKGIVHYNIAFAHVRANQLIEARTSLEQAIQHKTSKTQVRAEALLKRVQHAIEKGTQLTIAKNDHAQNRPMGELHGTAPGKSSENHKADEAKEAAKGKVLAVVDNKPGDMACHMVYKSSVHSAKITKMLEGQVRFNPRKAIERAESMGADKMAATGG